MRIVFDIAACKQVPFFKPMMARLVEMGYEVDVVTRAWDELDLVREHFGVQGKVLGEHGGETLLGKLLASAERVRQLALYFDETRPDALVTLCVPESSRAAFGLGVPIVCFLDLPESTFVSKLALPLASRVCAPWILPTAAFTAYGVDLEKLFFYHSLDPVLWLQDRSHSANADYVRSLDLDPGRPLVVCRETEWQASYVDTDIVRSVAEMLRERHPDWQIVCLSRYDSHRFYDTPSLLAAADLFIGGGGTMCIEAAYFGTPVIATRALESRYITWLFEHQMALRADTLEETLARAESIMSARNASDAASERRHAAGLFEALPFPLEAVVEVILQTAAGHRVADSST